MISVQNLTKRFGGKPAVDNLTFDVKPGAVTGFLGPNGAGKTTTLRMVVGLARPDQGSATVNGVPYRQLKTPTREVGALLDAKAYHPGRKARDHLVALAQAGGLDPKRADEVLDIVGLTEVAQKRAGTFSLGMAQRLGIAAALLGDPGVLLFDEPVNGLDPEGIIWARHLMQSLAAQGRTVLVSSHLMSEMALTATYVIVIGRGHLITSSTVDEMIQKSGPVTVKLRTPMGEAVIPRLVSAGGQAQSQTDGSIMVSGLEPKVIGDIVFQAGAPVHELAQQEVSLEEAFMELTRDDVEYHAGALGPVPGPGAPLASGGPTWPK